MTYHLDKSPAFEELQRDIERMLGVVAYFLEDAPDSIKRCVAEYETFVGHLADDGSTHIICSDGNFEDENIAFCRRRVTEEAPGTCYEACVHWFCDRLMILSPERHAWLEASS